MNKEEILKILKEKNIISQNNKRRFCWKQYWDNEVEEIFNKFKKSYRTENEAWFCLLNNIEPYHCEVCGELAKFTGTKKTKYPGYNTTCEKCSPNKSNNKLEKFHNSINNRTNEERKKIIEKRKKTNLEKYGDENYTLFGSKSFKENMIQKYGDEYFNNREKSKKTCLERYGVTCNLQMSSAQKRSLKFWKERKNEIRNKQKQNSLQKYGYESPNQCPEIIEKQKQGLINHFGNLENAYKHKYKLNKKTKFERYGDENYHNKEQAIKTLKERHLKFEIENNCTKYYDLINLYGQGWKSLNLPIIYSGRFRYISNEYIDQIKKYSEEQHNLKSISNQENDLYKYISSLTKYKIIRNSKNIIFDDKQKYELDIYIPKLKIAFEYNGNYWHTEKIKGKYYHQIKSKLCYSNGIQLIHIYEFEWLNNNEKIKQQIKELLEGKDCSKYNWISIKDYNNYTLSEPQIIKYFIRNNIKEAIYNEGKFIKNISNI